MIHHLTIVLYMIYQPKPNFKKMPSVFTGWEKILNKETSSVDN